GRQALPHLRRRRHWRRARAAAGQPDHHRGPLLHRCALGSGRGRGGRPPQRDRHGRVHWPVHPHLQPRHRRDHLWLRAAGQRGGVRLAAGGRRQPFPVLRGDRQAGRREDPRQDQHQRTAAGLRKRAWLRPLAAAAASPARRPGGGGRSVAAHLPPWTATNSIRSACMTTLYGLKNCDTCKKATKWLDRFGVPYTFVDYRDNKPSPETLVEWAGKAGGFDALVNKSSTTWRQLPDNRKSPG